MLTENFIHTTTRMYREGAYGYHSMPLQSKVLGNVTEKNVTLIRDMETGEYHGVEHGNDAYDGGGDYIVVGDSLRSDLKGVYVEIDDGTYGTYHGVRIYRNPEVG